MYSRSVANGKSTNWRLVVFPVGVETVGARRLQAEKFALLQFCLESLAEMIVLTIDFGAEFGAP